jgi:hypothetical protein
VPEQLSFATDAVALTQINGSGSTYVRTFRYKRREGSVNLNWHGRWVACNTPPFQHYAILELYRSPPANVQYDGHCW